ncbi:MAG TPA: hypothetical protein VHU89_18710 [Acidobacteriaceae bacterium]|jgi:hypothetical protein|nr:hypothetical protein [Acidobacteriaceae bacterium]
MFCRHRTIGLRFLAGLLPLGLAAPAFAISCTTQSQMKPEQRTVLAQSAQMLAANVKNGNAEGVRAQTIAAVASNFGGIANTIQAMNASIQRATLTVDQLYLLDATDLKAPQDAQFFCGVTGSPLTVEVTIPNLPPGKYALAVLHATGVEHPQQLSMILQNDPVNSAVWKLAGFFTKPMTIDGHDGVWFWRQARTYSAQKDDWTAWFLYKQAQLLLEPVDFISSPNLQKLQKETQESQPVGVPSDTGPVFLNTSAGRLQLTDVHVGEFNNQMDLIVTYNAPANLTPVQGREQVVALMKALLQQHPGLATAFHGMWVHASAPGGQTPFALELPMNQIQNSAPVPGERS